MDAYAPETERIASKYRHKQNMAEPHPYAFMGYEEILSERQDEMERLQIIAGGGEIGVTERQTMSDQVDPFSGQGSF